MRLFAAMHETDRPPFSGRPSLTGNCGHGRTFSLPRPVANDRRCRKSRRFVGGCLGLHCFETWSRFRLWRSQSVLGFSRCWRELGCNGWPDGTERQGLKVLYDSGEMEFVTRAGQPSKPHAFKSVVDLEVSKMHLDALTFIP